MSSPKVIILSSGSEKSNISISDSDSSSSCGTSDSSSSNDVAKGGNFDNNTVNNDHKQRNRILYVHTTKLEDMLIFKKKFNIQVPNNIVKRVEDESRPKNFHCTKRNRLNRRVKDIARVRYNIKRINEFNKNKTEATRNKYNIELNTCKPVSIDLIDLKHYNNVYLQNTSKIQLKDNVDATFGAHKDLLEDILAIDNDHLLPPKTYNIENMRVWCSQTMERISSSTIEKRAVACKTKPTTIEPLKLKIEDKLAAGCEYVIIGKTGYIESYYLVTSDTLIKYVELKLLADIKALGYQSIIPVVLPVCCWYDRKKKLELIAVPPSAKSFLKGSHSCGSTVCKCCCKSKVRYNRDNKESSLNVTRLKNNTSDKKQNSTGLLSTTEDRRVPLKRKKISEPEKTIQPERSTLTPKVASTVKKVKTFQDIYREVYEGKKPLHNSKPASYTQCPAPIDLTEDTMEDNLNNLVGDPNTALDKSGNIFKTVSINKTSEPVNIPKTVSSTSEATSANDILGLSNLPLTILSNPEIHGMIRSTLEQFKNIKLVINSDGQLAAHIDKSLVGNDLSQEDLQTLSNIIQRAQSLVLSLKTKSQEDSQPLKKSAIKQVNIAPKNSFPRFCEMSSDFARKKRDYYLKCLNFLVTQAPCDTLPKVRFSGAKEALACQKSALVSRVTKTPQASPLNYILENMKVMQSNTYIPNPVLNQDSAGKYVTLIPIALPQNIQLGSPPPLSYRKNTQPQAASVVAPVSYPSAIGVPASFVSANLIPIAPSGILPGGINTRLNSVYLPLNELQKNTQVVNIPGTRIQISNYNINSQNVLLSESMGTAGPSNVGNNTPTIINKPSQPSKKKDTSLNEKSNRVQIAKKSYRSPHFSPKRHQKDSEAIVPAVTASTNSQMEDEINVDWESRIVSNSLMTTDNSVLSVECQQSSSADDTMPKIAQVFSLNTEAIFDLGDSN